jgi:hypothetical protein
MKAAFLDKLHGKKQEEDKKADGVDMSDFEIPEEEEELVSEFL